jgi:hypothetical protein
MNEPVERRRHDVSTPPSGRRARYLLHRGSSPSSRHMQRSQEGQRGDRERERERRGAGRRAGRHEPRVLRVQRALPRRRAPDLDVRAGRRRAVGRVPGVGGGRRRRAVVVVRRRGRQRGRRGRRRRVQHRAVGAAARGAPAALHLPLGRRSGRDGDGHRRQREDGRRSH